MLLVRAGPAPESRGLSSSAFLVCIGLMLACFFHHLVEREAELMSMREREREREYVGSVI